MTNTDNIVSTISCNMLMELYAKRSRICKIFSLKKKNTLTKHLTEADKETDCQGLNFNDGFKVQVKAMGGYLNIYGCDQWAKSIQVLELQKVQFE